MRKEKSTRSSNEPKVRCECTRCGNCCRWPGPVYLVGEEAGILADFLGISVAEFTGRYTRLFGRWSALSLTEKEDGSCILLSGNRCLVHDVKPQQCRDFPNKWNFPGFKEFCNARRVDAL